MKRVELNLPMPVLMGTRYFFWRSELEFEKSRLRAIGMGRQAPEYAKPEIDNLVPAEAVAREFGISGRTLYRRISELGQPDKYYAFGVGGGDA